mmetsp:Transcript_39701/g.64992  ORF Transcript_39701/g.64992 Transcript_39701/m.64992 type:complete len:252 (-) Transcript_39701:321-1076(-)
MAFCSSNCALIASASSSFCFRNASNFAFKSAISFSFSASNAFNFASSSLSASFSFLSCALRRFASSNSFCKSSTCFVNSLFFSFSSINFDCVLSIKARNFSISSCNALCASSNFSFCFFCAFNSSPISLHSRSLSLYFLSSSAFLSTKSSNCLFFDARNASSSLRNLSNSTFCFFSRSPIESVCFSTSDNARSLSCNRFFKSSLAFLPFSTLRFSLSTSFKASSCCSLARLNLSDIACSSSSFFANSAASF